MGQLLRTAWDRYQIIGQSYGDYVSRFIILVMYFTVLVPFALIAQLTTDPLSLRKTIIQWRTRKPVGTSLENARSQS